jgi:A/G-specific adenine glycosylase
MLPNNLASIRRKLLAWYDEKRRDLPWRHSRDPYAIWIAETMLQQTQVATALPYYKNFLRAFPTIEALDRAPLERVLGAWSGLGYYRRAENLKRAARQIRADHGGALPADFAALRQLPGIGNYTAGALMSIAFGQRYPAVDGNVRRVLGRVFATTDAPRLNAIAGALVPPARPGDFNQALMELGATLCAPRKPRCGECPLAIRCAAQTRPHRDLAATPARAVKFFAVDWPLVIVRRRKRILLRRRAANGLLAQLWELPGGENSAALAPPAFLRGELQPLNWKIRRLHPIGQIRHSITYRRIRAPIYLVDCPANAALRLPNNRWRWIDPQAATRLPVSSMTAKALKTLAS